MALYVGRLTFEKGLLDLCAAAGLLVGQAVDRVKFLIVGDGPDRPCIEGAARRLAPGRFVFAGQRNEVEAILRAADFFVFPSLHENLPNVLLEAMACGRVVVATDVGGNPEVIIPGETGLLVPAPDPRALAQAIAVVNPIPGCARRWEEPAVPERRPSSPWTF